MPVAGVCCPPGRIGAGGFLLAGRGAAPRAALLFTAAGLLVDRGPGARFGFLFGQAFILIGVLDVLGLALLFLGVLAFVAAWHGVHSCSHT